MAEKVASAIDELLDAESVIEQFENLAQLVDSCRMSALWRQAPVFAGRHLSGSAISRAPSQTPRFQDWW